MTMSFLTALRQALSSLLVHKGRSALTSLGIVIGIGAVIALVAAGEGARQKLDERLESAGKNLIIIRPGGHGFAPGLSTDFVPLTSKDADAIRKRVGSHLLGVVPWQVTPRVASTRTNNWRTIVVGTTPDFRRVGEWRVARGRSFDEDDAKKLAPVCLLGQTARRKLFPAQADPVGEMVRIGALRVRVIGVLAPKGFTPLGVDQDDQIFLPLAVLQRKVVGKESLAMILANARSAEDIEPAKAEIVKVLRLEHRLRPGMGNDFDVSSVQELAELAVVVTRTLEILVAGIAAIALVVGGIGLMNIMLVAVTERTREIGIRMALGAAPRDVLVQFLLEAVVLAFLGGIGGVMAGLVLAVALARAANWPIIVSPGAVLLAFGVTAAVGIFFGYYPALRASRLDPIEALRYE
jgi:putative ABC transport system permease protein